jgi:hypothetical protein
MRSLDQFIWLCALHPAGQSSNLFGGGFIGRRRRSLSIQLHDLRDEQQVSLEQVLAPIMQSFCAIDTCTKCFTLWQI